MNGGTSFPTRSSTLQSQVWKRILTCFVINIRFINF
jgi:hypothetical protein